MAFILIIHPPSVTLGDGASAQKYGEQSMIFADRSGDGLFKEHVAKAGKLIEEIGYHRRDGELRELIIKN